MNTPYVRKARWRIWSPTIVPTTVTEKPSEDRRLAAHPEDDNIVELTRPGGVEESVADDGVLRSVIAHYGLQYLDIQQQGVGTWIYQGTCFTLRFDGTAGPVHDGGPPHKLLASHDGDQTWQPLIVLIQSHNCQVGVVPSTINDLEKPPLQRSSPQDFNTCQEYARPQTTQHTTRSEASHKPPPTPLPASSPAPSDLSNRAVVGRAPIDHIIASPKPCPPPLPQSTKDDSNSEFMRQKQSPQLPPSSAPYKEPPASYRQPELPITGATAPYKSPPADQMWRAPLPYPQNQQCGNAASVQYKASPADMPPVPHKQQPPNVHDKGAIGIQVLSDFRLAWGGAGHQPFVRSDRPAKYGGGGTPPSVIAR